MYPYPLYRCLYVQNFGLCFFFLGSTDTVDELTRSHLQRYGVSSLGDMVYCKGCKQDRKEFTGTNKSCDICTERARKYKENNAESVKEGHSKYRANNRDMLNQRRRDLRATEEYRTKEWERAKELGKVMYTCAHLGMAMECNYCCYVLTPMWIAHLPLACSLQGYHGVISDNLAGSD